MFVVEILYKTFTTQCVCIAELLHKALVLATTIRRQEVDGENPLLNYHTV